MALLFLVGGISTIILYVDDTAFWESFTVRTLPFIAALLFFFGSMTVAFLKIFYPKATGYVYAIVGAAIMFPFAVMLAVGDVTTELNSVEVLWQYVVPLIVFGVQPFVRGLIRFIESEQAQKAAYAKLEAKVAEAEAKPTIGNKPAKTAKKK